MKSEPDISTEFEFFVPIANADTDRRFGSKAGSLARLIRAGVRVPEGFAFRAVDRDAPGFSCELEKVLGSLGASEVIVRSSAEGEDGRMTSFAGILESITVKAESDLVFEAIGRCSLAVQSERCRVYEREQGRKLGGLGLVLQRKIRPRWAGVLFTRSPVSSQSRPAETLVYAEFATGDGSRVVDGRVNPSRLFACREDGRILGGEVGELPGFVARELVERSLELEEVFGEALDLEWLFNDETGLQFVQARAITTRPLETNHRSLGNAIPEPRSHVLWSNANISENYPDPASPMLASIAKRAYYSYFRNLALRFGMPVGRVERAEPELRQIVGQHNGYLYYNLSSIRFLCSQLPFGAAITRSFDRFMTVPAELVGSDGEDRPGFFESLGVGLGIVWALIRAGASTKTFASKVESAVCGIKQAEQLGTCKGVLGGLDCFGRVRFDQWTNAAIADTSAMFSTSILRHLLLRWYEGDQVDNIHRGLLSGVRHLASSEPAQALEDLAAEARGDRDLRMAVEAGESLEERWPAFVTMVRDYQMTWGHRCSGELTLKARNLQDDLQSVLSLVRSYLKDGSRSPGDSIEEQAREREALEKELRHELGFVRSSMLFSVRHWCHNSLRLRERSRGEQARLYASLQSLLGVAGSLLVEKAILEDAADILELEFNELHSLLEGPENQDREEQLRAKIRKRQEQAAAEQGQRPPDHFVLARGQNWREGVAVGREAKVREGGLVGLGACPGRIAARAAVIHGIGEASVVERGDILVAPQTDPGWVPLFPLIGGLVVERGGLLSHGAIVAREFGIPAVVGVKGAMKRIKTGQWLELDGREGTINVD